MNDFERTNHPFIVRIWLEETGAEAGQAVWRGRITHVPNGVRCYLRELDDIIFFIIPYLGRMGVRFGWRWRIQRLLNILKPHHSL